MKDSTILKDELRLLIQNRSVLVKELDRVGDELKETNNQLVQTESQLRIAKSDLSNTFSSANYIAGLIVDKENVLRDIQLLIDTATTKLNHTKVISSQEINLLNGKIKELKEDIDSKKSEISALKDTYDNNSKIYIQHVSEKNVALRKLDIEIELRSDVLLSLDNEIESKIKEKELLEKEKFERENILIERERTLDMLVKGNELKQHDLDNASRDLIIVYQRLKELYAIVDPKLDVDRLFSKLLKQ